MSEATEHGSAARRGPHLIGDRKAPAGVAAPRQGELAFPAPGDDPPLVPARMVNEYSYCPRLAYLEWVQGEWADSADTVEGTHAHRRVDRGGGSLPSADADDFERLHARSVTLSSERLGLIARIDLIEADGGRVVPVDYKRGKRPHVKGGAYEPERVQLCVQGLILREQGIPVRGRGVVFRGRARTRAGAIRPGTGQRNRAGRGRAAPGRGRGEDPAAARRQPEVPALLAGEHLPCPTRSTT